MSMSLLCNALEFSVVCDCGNLGDNKIVCVFLFYQKIKAIRSSSFNNL